MNLSESALGYLSSGVIEKASALVGESPAGTRRALDTAVPAIVAGLAAEASQSGGPGKILRVVEDAGLSGPESAVSERLSAASGEELVGLGKDLIGRVFGDRLGVVIEAAAHATGVAPASMTQLAGLTAPLVFGVLGSTVHARHLDGAGLAGLLGAQRAPALHALPAQVAAALTRSEGAMATEVAASRAQVRREIRRARPAPSPSRFWPLLLVIPLALLAALYFRRPATESWGSRARMGAGLPAPSALPGAAVGTAVAAEMAEFLAQPSAEASKRFVFEDLNFETATANLMPQALDALDGVASVLKAHPNAVVLVEGHTDATGSAEDNLRLSMSRADAVKNALIARGVSPDRIATAGIGQDRPVASNETPEGRARNRRTELVVTR
jgi:outer membrane protein OmpA-like peptidoglycan-associated protein